MPMSRSVIRNTGVCSRSARSSALRRHLEALVRVLGEEQHVLGVAVRGVGARRCTSDCCVRVGMPVEGPPRCTSMMVTGISAKYARPMNSLISEMPGPVVAVKARAPFQPAPVTMPIEASSSSAWMIANLFLPVSLSTRSFEQ